MSRGLWMSGAGSQACRCSLVVLCSENCDVEMDYEMWDEAEEYGRSCHRETYPDTHSLSWARTRQMRFGWLLSHGLHIQVSFTFLSNL